MQVPSKQTAHRILLVLCVIVFLLLIRPINEKKYEGTGAYQEVQIPLGMRVLTVPVSNKTIPDKSLLCPGCYVDVITTRKLKKSKIPDVIPDFVVDVLIKCKLIRDNRGAVSTTMLRGIQVLSIKRGVRGTFVNLLVTPKQAEALLLAMKNSSILATVRNKSPNKIQEEQNR